MLRAGLAPGIVEWLDWNAARTLLERGEARNQAEPLFGGPWRPTRNWPAYRHSFPEEAQPLLEGLRRAILRFGFRGSAFWIDRGERWVPCFPDRLLLLFSSDSWAELQAAVWSEAEGVTYQITDWLHAIGGEEPVRDRGGALRYAFRIYDPPDPSNSGPDRLQGTPSG